MATVRHLDEVEAAYQDSIKARNAKIAELRHRSGLSMDDLAKAMGFKGQSSIQRYLSPDYDKGFRPELAMRFCIALIGEGDPPISADDLLVFSDTRHLPEKHPEIPDAPNVARTQIEQAYVTQRSGGEGKATIRSSLPLLEGDLSVNIPRDLSPESVESARMWLAHILNLATKKPKPE